MSTPQKYQIDDIRSRFQTVAVSNYYQAFFEVNAYLLRAAAKRGITNRFVAEDLGLYVSDAVLPGSSFADIEVSGDRQGITERVPYSRIYDDVTFTFFVDRDYKVMKFFECWNELINPLKDGFGGNNAETMRLTYPEFYKCQLKIYKFNKDSFRENGQDDYFSDDRGAIAYTFINAWPYSVASTPVSYNGSNILQLNVTFRYDRYVVKGVTIAERPIISTSGSSLPRSQPSTQQKEDLSSSDTGQRLIPVRGNSGVVFYDANIDTRTTAEVNRRFFNSQGRPIIN